MTIRVDLIALIAILCAACQTPYSVEQHSARPIDGIPACAGYSASLTRSGPYANLGIGDGERLRYLVFEGGVPLSTGGLIKGSVELDESGCLSGRATGGDRCVMALVERGWCSQP